MKKLLLVVVLFTAVFTSCKKDCPVVTPVVPTYPIEGSWVGKYGNGATAPSLGYSMVVEAGGKIVVADGATINGSAIANGTYTMTGNVFKGTYTYTSSGLTFSFQANFNNAGKLESGTWGSGASVTGGGTWYMDRKN
ncbi:MAG: hypothetical protein HOO89_04255 [Ferruginibacter sp.]|nr:hypothetical protein [Ferruginibacter sp.]